MTSPHRLFLAAAGCVIVLLMPRPAASQPPETVQDLLGFLVTNQGVDTSDFDRDREAAEATRATLTRALLASIAQVPMTTASSGFTYRLNSMLGTNERASQTFGPFFVERALTSGAGQASFGAALQYARFDRLDGNDLRRGDLVTVANRFVDEADPFDVEALTLAISTQTTTLFGSVGITDRLDLSAAVPIVALSITGTRENIYRGRALLQTRGRARTVGFGDVAIRSKLRLSPEGSLHAAAAVEVRLPTGRTEDLLGAGEAALRVMGIGSAELGAASVHGNIAVGGGGLGREWSYAGAVAVAATPRLTLTGELLARRSRGTARIAEVLAPHPRLIDVATIRLVPVGDDRTAAFAVAGLKWNVGGTWLLQGNVLFPVLDIGLTARVTPMLTLDYAFTR